MKYVYVVTRIINKIEHGIIHIPNLGVHRSYKAALAHFTEVANDRGGGVSFSVPKGQPSVCQLMNEFHCKSGDETLRLEKWNIKPTQSDL